MQFILFNKYLFFYLIFFFVNALNPIFIHSSNKRNVKGKTSKKVFNSAQLISVSF